MEHHDVFRKNYLVFGLKDEVIDQIEQLAHPETFLAQDFLVKHGQKSSDLYVILDGFDLGVGILLLFQPTMASRDHMIDSITPTETGAKIIFTGIR